MNKKTTKKEITLDDLALMVAKGFNSVEKRFEQVDKRFEQVDKHFEKIEKHLGSIKTNLNKKVDKIDHNTLTYRFEKLEKKFA